MRVASWNVNSVNVRKPRLSSFVDRIQPDIVAIQELKCIDEKVPVTFFKDLGYHCSHFGQKNYNGVAILSRDKPDAVVRGLDNEFDQENARLIACQFGELHVICVYCPNGQEVGSEKFYYKLEWFEKLQNFLRDNYSPKDKILLLGDFNIAPQDRDVHDPVMMKEKISCSEKERLLFQGLLEFGLQDTFRIHNQDRGVFSWWDFRTQSFPINRGFRIDMVLASSAMAEICNHAWIDRESRKHESNPEKPSDHAPVIADFI